MKPEIQALRVDIRKVEGKLEHMLSCLKSAIRDCDHQWGGAEYAPDIQKAYTIPREEGMGSHPPRPECHVPQKVTRKWARPCKDCGYVQTTTKTKEVQAMGFGISVAVGTRPLMVEMPDFEEAR